MKLGELQTLKVEKTVPFGIYLTGGTRFASAFTGA